MVQLRSSVKQLGTPGSVITEAVTVKWLGFFLGLWLVSIFLFPLISRIYLQGGYLQISYVAAILWPELLFLFVLKSLSPDKLSTNNQIALVLFFLSIMISSVMSVDMINTALFFILTIFVFVIILQFKTYLTISQYISALQTYAFFGLVVASLFALYDYRPGIRLGNGTDILNPNAISIVLMSIAVSAMAFKSLVLKLAVAGVAIFLLYLTGSRTSLVAMVIAIGIYGYYSVAMSSKMYKFLIALVVVLFAILGIAYFEKVWEVLNLVLKIDDSHRGISSGASGRIDIWMKAWSLFVDNIVTGIGYRSHEKVLGISAHNGYLATMLEIGLIGFLSIMYLIVKGVLNLKHNLKLGVEANPNHILFGFCFGYMFLAMFERYLVNIGNPASLLFLLAVLGSKKVVVNEKQ